MAHYKMLDGNMAAVEAIKMAKVKVVSAYPITPQSPIAAKLSESVADGSLDAAYIRVESEHTAMSCAVGAALTGVRTATATASVGLALMHEVLNVASGVRVPLVMPVVNRSLASPWSLWCDHQDSMAERDSGWLQFYCENVQDVFDTMLTAYRIAEDARVQTPAMVCLDGFFLSHSMQKILIPEQDEADRFIGPYTPHNFVLDPADPIMIDNLTGCDENEEMRYQQAVGFERAGEVIDEIFTEFEKGFGRRKSSVEGYRTEDADTVIVTMGSMSGTAKYVTDCLREQGQKVGAVKISVFRPFPVERLRQVIGDISRIAVLDRTAGLGAQGSPLWQEVRNAVDRGGPGGRPGGRLIKNYVGGLAGRDISTMTIEKVFEDIRRGEEMTRPIWIDCAENAMEIRQVIRND